MPRHLRSFSVASETFLLAPTEKYARYFSRVAWKPTREWKEEIVYLKDGPRTDTPGAFAELLPGVRFSRFDRGWYFIHNSGMHTVKGPWRFSSARREILVMEVVSGEIRRVSAGRDGSFAFEIKPGESVWVCTRP